MKSRILEQYEKMDDFEKITFDKLVKRCGKLYGEKIALKDLTERITYSELQKESEKIAQKLIGLGIRNSNIVLLQCINTVFFVKVLFGLLNLGAIPVLVLPAHREVEIIKMLEKTNAVAYIAPKEYMGFEYSNIEKKVKEYFPEIICLNEQSFDKEALDDIPIRENGIEIEYDDVALLLLSGGTTGEPKLIPRTHADYIYNAKKAAERSEMDKESVYLASMPMSHNMTLSSPGILGTLYMGGTVVMCSIPSPDDILETIERERVTITSLVPAVATLCVELLELDSFDISSVKTVIICGARMEEKLAKNIIKGFQCKLQNQYGTAEGLIMSTLLEDKEEIVIKCQGKPISEADEIRIVNENGKILSQGQAGEMETRGPYTITQYYNAEDSIGRFTDDGFYKTGDRVIQDENGNYRILGRIREVINRGGEKILPSEIEEELMRIKGVKKVVVVPWKDDVLGQKSCAFIEMCTNCFMDKKQIIQLMLYNGAAQYKIPDKIEFINRWPTTKMEKIDTEKLKQLALEK